MLRLRTFGGLWLENSELEGEPLALRPRRLGILAMLAIAGQKGLTRDRVLAVLWPNSDEDRGRHALSQTLYGLRRDLGAEPVTSNGDVLRLDSSVIATDVGAFMQAVQAKDSDTAARVYSGPFLDGVYLADAPEFDRWAEEERGILARDAGGVLEVAARKAAAAGDHAGAIEWWSRLIRLDQLSSRYALGYMEALAAAGDTAGAIAHGRAHATLVQRELETEPDREIVDYIEAIRSAERTRSAPVRTPRPPVAAPTAPSPTPESTPVEPAPTPSTQLARARRIAVAPIVGIGVAATLLIGFILFRGMRSGGPGTGSPTLAVGLLVDQTGPDSARVGGVLSDMLTTSLSRLSNLRLVANTRLLELMPPGADTTAAGRADAARRAGANEILEGEVSRLGENRLHLELRRVDLRRGVVRRGYRVDAADRFALVDSATVVLARDLGITPPVGTVSDVSTRSPIAYRLYEEGLRAYYQYDGFGAYRLFRAAIAEDSSFALATYYAYLAAIGADPAAVDSLADRALTVATRTTDRARLLIRTVVGTGRNDPRAPAVAESLISLFPDDPEALVRAADALSAATTDMTRTARLLDRAITEDSAVATTGAAPCRLCEAANDLVIRYLWADSLDAAERSARRYIALRPKDSRSWWTLSWVLIRRRLADAEAAGRRGDSLAAPGTETGAFDRSLRFHLMVDDYDWANRSCGSALAQTDHSEATERAAWLCTISLRAQGQYRAALALVRDRRNPWGSEKIPGLDRFHEAILDFEMGRPRLAADAWSATAAEGAAGRASDEPSAAWYLTLRATALFATYDTILVRRLVDSIETAGRQRLYGRDPKLHHFVRGLLARRAKRYDEAVTEFRSSIFSWPFGYTMANLELARTYREMGRPQDAIYPLQAALRGDLDGSPLYVTRTVLHEALAQSFDLAGQRDSAAAHYRIVERAWRHADAALQPRYVAAKEWLDRGGRRP